MGRSTASSRDLFQGCQIGDDVGTIPGLRQSLEEHFRAVNVPAWICEIGIQCGCSPRESRKNYATDHEGIPFINFVSRLYAIWQYLSGGSPSAEVRNASLCKSFTRGWMCLCAVVSRSAATVQRIVLEGGSEIRVMFCVTRTRTC